MFEHRDGSTVRVQPRLGQDGSSGNSTRCGSPFLWVLSFGEAKVKYLDGGARPAKLNAVALDENRVAITKSKQALHPLTRMTFPTPLPRGGRERGLAWPSPPSPPRPPRQAWPAAARQVPSGARRA